MISVCMATHNGETYIKEQIRSILDQLSPPDELVISDDGSTDSTLEIVSGFIDSRIRIIQSPFNNDLYRNFQHALMNSKGDILFLADQDDIWLPERISDVLPLLEQYTLVTCDCDFIAADGSRIAESYMDRRESGTGFFRNLIKNGFVGCCMAFQRIILDNALPLPRRVPMHDWWIGLCAEVFATTYFHKRILVHHRVHDANASTTASTVPFSPYQQAWWRLYMISAILSRRLKSSPGCKAALRKE